MAKKVNPLEEGKKAIQEIRDTFRRAGGKVPGEERKKPEPEGICVVCKTVTVVPSMRVEPFTMSTPIGSPRGRYREGYHCTTCGVKYEFPVKEHGGITVSP